jgi:hypothetical protein
MSAGVRILISGSSGHLGETLTRALRAGVSRRMISHELPVTSTATRSVGRRLSASVFIPSGVEGTRRGTTPCLLADCDVTVVKGHIQPNLPTGRGQ